MTLLPVEVALERVLRLSSPLPMEQVQVSAALGRALAAPVVATRTLPPWDNSAMDGYAVRSSDAVSVGTRLEVTSIIHAGERPTRPVGAGEAARIMTGAPLPEGADAVVMQERVTVEGAFVVVSEVARAGQNVRRRGEDVEAGALLLTEGARLGIGEAGLLWAQGITSVPVRRRPRVAIASSGDELCDVTEAPNGRIVDTNTPVIAELVRLCGGEPVVLGRAPDRLEAVEALLAKGLDFDVLVAVSGASVGERDFTREALSRLGVEMDFWKVAMKPGKPLAVGRRGATLVFGLPGNPVSSMVTFELFVRPALRALLGLPPIIPPLPGRLAAPLAKPAGLRHFVRATVKLKADGLWATPLKSQSSGALTSAAGATHLISIAPDVTQASAGEVVDVLPLSWGA